ncbi:MULTISPECIES: hypothetical protein [Faecalibacterium]|uniref:hypothetical protein n=1 Tax=Faecalibacterium TaxID=216851 RepID=UPI000E4EFA2C|nr:MULTISPECIES: hypothetical protein [Faecalibacterium]RHQ27695.1 hypothetical protein DWY95_09090 [Faecalibacterium sp. AF28-13AC]
MLIFEKNLFYDCTKKELEKIVEAIKEDKNNGVLTFGMEAMKVQIKRIRERFSVSGNVFDCVSAYNLAKEELYDEIAERYFSI